MAEENQNPPSPEQPQAKPIQSQQAPNPEDPAAPAPQQSSPSQAPKTEVPPAAAPAPQQQSPQPPQSPPANPQPPQPTKQESQSEGPKSETIPPINDENWNEKEYLMNRTFYKTYSPRVFYLPFSLEVDILRAKQLAEKAGFKVPQNPLILDKAGMFWTDLLIEVVEVEEAKQDPNLIRINNTFHTITSKENWLKMKGDIAKIKLKLAKEPSELYVLHASKVEGEKNPDIQRVILAN